MALTANVLLQFVAKLTGTGDLATPQADLSYRKEIAFANGTGANQAQQVFSDTRTLAASASEDLDMSGVLSNLLGTTVSFTKVKALLVHADVGNTNDVLVGGATATQFSSWAGDPTDVVKVKPGGYFVLVAPDANGYAVTNTSADLLKIANSAGTTSVAYDIIVIGV